MDENTNNLRSNEELGQNILIFYAKVAELAEVLVKKTGWNGLNFLLK